MNTQKRLKFCRVGCLLVFISGIILATEGPHSAAASQANWRLMGEFFVVASIILWIRTEINLSSKNKRKVKRGNQERRYPTMPIRDYETKPTNGIFPVDVTQIGKNLPSFSGNQGFENPLSVMARTNPKRVSDLIEQLSNDKLTDEVDKRSKEMVQEVLRNRPDANEVTDRVTIIDKKGPFGVLRRRRVHIENVAVRKKGDKKK